MLVLGLDPSLTNYGWAIYDSEAEGQSRCPQRGRFQTTPKMPFVDRYIYMREHLRELIQTYQPDRVGIESPVFNDLWSEGMYGLFLYSNEALKLEKKDVVFFSPGQLKVHARHFLDRPKGWKMLKGDMVEAAKRNAGNKGRWNHNEADAFWAALAAARFWQFFEGTLQEGDLTPAEKHQFIKIHTYQRGKKAGQTIKPGLIHREEDRFFLWSVWSEG